MPVIKNTQTVEGEEITIFVEITDSADELETIYGDPHRGDRLEKAVDKVLDVSDDVFGKGLDLANSCALRTVDSINKMSKDVRPDEYEMQLAIQLNAGFAQVVEFGATAQMHISMKWLKPKPEEKP